MRGDWSRGPGKGGLLGWGLWGRGRGSGSAATFSGKMEERVAKGGNRETWGDVSNGPVQE